MTEVNAAPKKALRIGITQRHQPEGDNSFARDALDAAWSDWIAQALPEASHAAIPNFSDPEAGVRYVESWDFDALILSGGEDVGTSPRRGAVERRLLEHAKQAALPVIGVCRGMQMLHCYTGGTVEPIPGHVAGQHLVFVDDAPMTVNSWHGFAVTSAGAQWRVLARTDDGCVEAMRHVDLPWLGIMWHPERPCGAPELTSRWITQLLFDR